MMLLSVTVVREIALRLLSSAGVCKGMFLYCMLTAFKWLLKMSAISRITIVSVCTAIRPGHSSEALTLLPVVLILSMETAVGPTISFRMTVPPIGSWVQSIEVCVLILVIATRLILLTVQHPTVRLLPAK
jgi:hypothetical protein